MEMTPWNTCEYWEDVNVGDLIVIQRKKDSRKILAQVKEKIERGGLGERQLLLSVGKNDYFNFDMYCAGNSWVNRMWNIGAVELTTITNNKNEFPRG